MQKYQNTNTTKCKLTKRILDIIQINKIRMRQNPNTRKYKSTKMEKNKWDKCKKTKYKNDKIQTGKN